MAGIRLGLTLRPFGLRGRPDHVRQAALARLAEHLGYSVLWTAEETGSDAATLLAWLAAQTSTIELGTAAMQMPGRTPALTAMTAATLDAVSGGRLRLGLGMSGPQVVEGWHGQPFTDPLARTREYVDVVRAALRSSGKHLVYQGKYHQLPIQGGPGKPLGLGMRPVREQVPIYLAAVGPRNLELAGEIADGWLSVLFEPESADVSLARLRAGRRGDLTGFDVAVSVPALAGDDLAACRDSARVYTAHLLGGMGSRTHNFYNQLAVRMGYGAAADEVQQHYLAGRLRSAVAAVPDRLVDRTALLGSVDRIADRLSAYAAAGVSTVSVIMSTRDLAAATATVRAVAQALNKSGLGR
ncbi:LLM class F420-dependent oxidoreductase [Nocardia altamirensis]|uniref:LLM class F420-dependent oxidoreductase n=1 Tax=Nocardia altamirensis TaxID=472158 RepID=UPI000ABC4EC2|nr:LLM class F420-dependent oxidoreductase [Nocardia altamirensis]